jgi:metal-responsive CopG/Arc/MetJ family transcriptional regulator
MRRTQLYLDDDLWETLHTRAHASGSTISELVRDAVRERYLGSLETRNKAMQAVVGLWKNRREIGDSTAHVRKLRRGKRLNRLDNK